MSRKHERTTMTAVGGRKDSPAFDPSPSTFDESELPLELLDPKAVFWRSHTDAKVHRFVDHYFPTRGLVCRSLDRRHEVRTEPERSATCTCFNWRCTCPKEVKPTREGRRECAQKRSRELLIHSDPFGMDSMCVPYSLSKKQRWQLAAYFEHAAGRFQHPHQNVSAVLATSEYPLMDTSFGGPSLFTGRLRHSRAMGSQCVKRLIACNPDGSLYVRENDESGGHSYTYLPALPTASADLPKALSKRQKRALRRKQKEEGVDLSVEAPVRVTYYAHDPKTSARFMNARANNNRWPRMYSQNSGRNFTNKPWRAGGEFLPFDQQEALDFDLDGRFAATGEQPNEDESLQHAFTPARMTLADFLPAAAHESADGFEVWPTIDGETRDSSPISDCVYVDCDGFVYF